MPFLRRSSKDTTIGVATKANPSAVQNASEQAPATKETDSLAPLVPESQSEPQELNQDQSRRKSWFKRLSSSGTGETQKKEKRGSISDSGPFVFAFDPRSGKEILQRNPHWPNEDSWKREKEDEGTWAMGSMMGNQKKDFGGTIG